MEPTKLILHSQFQVGEVDPRIFGGFLEHMGRAVYEGIYDPACAHADADGFRTECAAECPYKAIELMHAKDDQMAEEIPAFG